ncbi:MAG: serine hydrolase, partial [Proteobacteria bacterium]|nr:serine hydrolase [Pseudomonadota bacterium]
EKPAVEPALPAQKPVVEPVPPAQKPVAEPVPPAQKPVAESVQPAEDSPRVYPLPRAQPREIGLSSENLNELSAYLKMSVKRGRFPGAVALMARHGKIGYFESFGTRDRTTRLPMKRDAIFRIHSMTEPIVCVAVLMLTEEGRLSLDDPVSRYIPELGGLKVGAKKVPSKRDMIVLDLLKHTSGLTNGVLFKSEVKSMYLKAGIQNGDQTIREMVAKLGLIPLAYQPGTKWEYGRSVDVLGRLVEVVSGKPLDRFLEERIFEPLMMVDTGFYVKPENIDRLAEPGKHSDVKAPPKLLSGGAGLTSTVGDYFRFAQMLLNGGELEGRRILKKETVELMTSDQLGRLGERSDPQYAPGENFGFGLGVAVKTKAVGWWEPGLYYWMGSGGTIFTVHPKTDSIGILMFQGPKWLGVYLMKFLELTRKSIY